MDWKNIIKEITDAGKTQVEIGVYAGIKQASVSDLARGRTQNVTWDVGQRLIALHKRVTRRRK